MLSAMDMNPNIRGRTIKRIVLKCSGEALRQSPDGVSINPATVQKFACRIREALSLGVQVSIVIGGGNIYRGNVGHAQGIDRNTGDFMGMLATVINALALQDAFVKAGIDTRVQTAIEMKEIAEPFILKRAVRHLEKGRTLIFAGGTGNPYFTTDTAAALRASEIGADALLKATKVDGVYAEDPLRNPAALKYDTLSYAEALAGRLGIMDATAFSLCRENRIPIVVFDFFQDGNIRAVMEGRRIGTLIS